MNEQHGATTEPVCPHCNSRVPADPDATRCPFCGMNLSSGQRPIAGFVRRSMIRSAQAYRLWSLGVFAFALIQLLRLGGFEAIFPVFCVLFPFSMALAVSYWKRDGAPRWIIAFLLLVDLGVIIAPFHQIFPKCNLFPRLPLTESRILTFYLVIYGLLQFVIGPPIVFFRSLRTRWNGGQPPLAPWICCFGLAVWGLIVFIITDLLLWT